MIQVGTEEPLAIVRRVLEQELGWGFPAHRASELYGVVSGVGRELGLSCVQALADALLRKESSRQALTILSRRLAVNETYFFRDAAVFRALEEVFLPRLISQRARERRTLRIWSAGCSSGEEVYSLVITLRRCLPSFSGWQVKVIGTDLGAENIERAKEGIYAKWAFREAPPWLKKRYFEPVRGGGHRVSEEIRALVEFRAHNLANGLPEGVENDGEVDLLLCRNVLMYFSAQKTAAVLDRFKRLVAEDGLLCVAPYEAFKLGGCGFESADVLGSSFFRHLRVPSRATPDIAVPPPRRPSGRGSKRTVRPVPRTRSTRSVERVVAANELSSEKARPEAYVEIRRLADAGRSWEALDRSEKLLESNPLDPELYYLRAMILGECGRLPESASALRQTLYLDSGFLLAHVALANIARVRGRELSAQRHVFVARQLLKARHPDEIIAGSGGMTAGVFLKILPEEKPTHEKAS